PFGTCPPSSTLSSLSLTSALPQSIRTPLGALRSLPSGSFVACSDSPMTDNYPLVATTTPRIVRLECDEPHLQADRHRLGNRRRHPWHEGLRTRLRARRRRR